LPLRTPLVPSASPLSQEIASIRRLEDAGASAVVLYSLFEEQLRQDTLELDHRLSAGTESFPEALSFFPQASEFRLGPEGYLEHIRKAKEAVDIPIIASLNGATVGGWAKFAQQIEQAGADALECNIYYIPTDPNLKAAEIEQTIADINVRSHTFAFIKPELTDQFKIPNPCTSCHTDRSTDWARSALKDWPGVSPWRAN
jgi:dihydroorotate dehydrogenase (fumarate)